MPNMQHRLKLKAQLLANLLGTLLAQAHAQGIDDTIYAININHAASTSAPTA